MMKIQHALILSAGFGTRLKPITDTIPKVLVPVAGVAMLDRCVALLMQNGIKKIYVNTHYLSEKVQQHIQNANYDAEVISVHEEVILGTGGGIRNIFTKFDKEPLLVMNCDAFFYDENPLVNLISKWDGESMKFLALLRPVDGAKKGDFSIDEFGCLSRHEPRGYKFVGCYIISSQVMEKSPEGFFPITDIIFNYSREFFGIVNATRWLDIGTHDDLKLANTNN